MKHLCIPQKILFLIFLAGLQFTGLAWVVLRSAESASECRPLSDGATAWWPGEDSRNVLGGEAGTFVGNAGLKPGRWGNAFAFDGLNDGVQVTATPGMNLQDLTVEAWIRRGDSNRIGNDGAAVLMGGQGGGWVFGLAPDGALLFGKVGLANVYSRPAVLDDQWHHVAVSRDGVQVRFYTDGQAVGEAAFSERFVPQDAYGIGGLSQPFDGLTYSFLGLIDDLTVYRRVLPASEVSSLAAATATSRCLDDVELVLLRFPNRVKQGGKYIVEAEVRNRSSLVASSVRIRAETPDVAEFLSGEASQGAVLVSDRTVTVQLGDLPAGATGRFALTWQVKADGLGWSTNRLTLEKTTVDQILANNEGVWSFLVTGDCTSAPSGMVAWWRGERDASEVLSASNGVASPTVRYVEGMSGTAFSFRENQSFITFPHSAATRVENFTVECWIRRESTQQVSPTGNHSFLVGGPLGSMGFGLVPDGRLYLHNIPSVSVFSTGRILDTSWHHVAVTRTGATVRFYIDGLPSGSTTFDTTFTFGDALWIGGLAGIDASNSYSFYGDLDELALFSRGLEPAEIATLANAGGAGRCLQDLRLTALTRPATVIREDPFEILMVAEETGTEAADGVRFVTALPPGLDYISGTSDQGTCTEFSGVVRCDIGRLEPGVPIQIRLRLRAQVERELRFDARLQSLATEITEANNQVDFRISVSDFQLSMEPLSFDEGPAGQTNRVEFRLRFNLPRSEPLQIAFASEDVSAVAGRDYLPEAGEQTIPAGTTQADIGVLVIGDAVYEATEQFRMTVRTVGPGLTRTVSATAVLRNDDLPPVLRVLPARWLEGDQGSHTEHWEAELIGQTDLPARFRYATESHTSREGTDYLGTSGNLEFAPGVGRGIVPIEILGDNSPEGDEAVLLRLTEIIGCRPAGVTVRGVVANDDVSAGVPDHFEVTPTAGPIEPGRPFPVTVTARDAEGRRMEEFNGAVAIDGRRGSGTPSRVVISEVVAGDTNQGDFVELINAGAEPVNVSAWRVLLFGPETWPDPTVAVTLPPETRLAPGQTVILEKNGLGAENAYHVPVVPMVLWAGSPAPDLFGEPVVAVLLLDNFGFTEDSFLAGRTDAAFLSLSAGEGGVRWNGPSVAASSARPHLFQRTGARNSRSAADWVTQQTPSIGTAGPALHLPLDDAASVPVVPGSLRGFSRGQWQGEVQFPNPVFETALFVDDGNGHTGLSMFLATQGDRDQDGLADAWEIEYGLSFEDPKDATADQDRDGYSALEEFECGTDPRDASSLHRIAIRNGRVEWVARAGRAYALESREPSQDSVWTLVRSWDAGAERLISEALDTSGTLVGRWFRVLVRRPVSL